MSHLNGNTVQASTSRYAAAAADVDDLGLEDDRLFDPVEVRRAWSLFVPRGSVKEVRLLEAKREGDFRTGTLSGYFRSPNALVRELEKITESKGCYFTINALDESLLARRANRLEISRGGDLTSDTNVVRRSWLVVDADAVRASGISATADEHSAAVAKIAEVAAYLGERGWPDPILVSSGNGGHAYFKIDLPAESALVERCLQALDAALSDGRVKIDVGVHNAARIFRLPGTRACKGDNLPERPHRMCNLLHVPDVVEQVADELLERLAPEASPLNPQRDGDGRAGGSVQEFIQRHGLKVGESRDWNGATLWPLEESPICGHYDRAAYVVEFPNGAKYAGCHHASCRGKWGWNDLLSHYEPRARNDITRVNAAEERVLSAPTLAPYVPFPTRVFPPAIRNYVSEAAAAIGCDDAYVALPMLASLGGAIGNRRVIELKASWPEPAVFWGAIVGSSGQQKTPAQIAGVQFLSELQQASFARWRNELEHFQVAQRTYERELNSWRRTRCGAAPTPPEAPMCERFIVGDATVEALVEILAAQRNGVVAVSDELAGWLGGIGQYKRAQGSDMANWLSVWSANPLTIDRKTAGTKVLHVPKAAVSVFGCIPPGVLRSVIGIQNRENGLLARLLLAWPPAKSIRWSEAGVAPETENAARQVFRRLIALEPNVDRENGSWYPQRVRLSAEAKRKWVAFYNRHRAEQATLDDGLAAAWSKLEAYCARFALVFQLAASAEDRGDSDIIQRPAMMKAVRLADWFGSEARRLYGMLAENVDDRVTRQLIELIRRRGGSVSVRQLMRGCPGQYKSAEEAERALVRLSNGGLGAWQVNESGPAGGHPARMFRLFGESDKTA